MDPKGLTELTREELEQLRADSKFTPAELDAVDPVEKSASPPGPSYPSDVKILVEDDYKADNVIVRIGLIKVNLGLSAARDLALEIRKSANRVETEAMARDGKRPEPKSKRKNWRRRA